MITSLERLNSVNFSSLLSVQEADLEDSLIELYEDHSRPSYWSNRVSLDFSTKKVKRIFDELTPKVRELYLRSLQEDYVLSKQEFEERFSRSGKELIQRGFYLWSEKQARFFPPNEFVFSLLPKSLIATLLQCTKAQLLKLWKENLYQLPKYNIIQKTLRDSNRRYGTVQLDANQLDQIAKRLRPYRIVTDKDAESRGECLRDKLFELAIELGIQKDWRYFATTNESLAALEEHLNPLLEEQLLFLQGDSANLKFVINPLIREALNRRILESAKAQFEAGIKCLQPLPRTTAVLNYRESFHVEPRNLLRIFTFLAAWIDSQRVRITEAGTPRVSDIKKLAKILSTTREELEFYLKLLEYLFKRGASPDAFRESRSISRRMDIWNVVVEISEKRLLKVLLKSEEEPFLQSFLTFLNRLPKEEWFTVEDIGALFDLFYCAEGGSLGVRNRIAAELPRLLLLARIFGRIDVLASKEGSGEVLALRVLPALTKALSFEQEASLMMQGNMEIPLPFGISPRQLFPAARLYDLQDVNTLIFTREVALRLSNASSSSQQALSLMESLLANDLPASAHKLLSRVFEDRIRVYFDGRCLYLYDPRKFEEIKSMIPPDRILEIVDQRLFILSCYGQDAVLVSRLEKNNVSIERGSRIV